MSKERLEYLMNQTYYNYLYTDEAQELIDYINQLQQENQQLKSVLDEIRDVLNNQMDYREFVDVVNAIEEILDKVKE